MTRFLRNWFVTVVAVLVAAKLVPGIEFRTLADLLVAGLLLGLLNAVVKPILWFLSLPLVILTLGLFNLIINAFLLLFVSWLMTPAFRVSGFKSALWGGLVISVILFILNALTGSDEGRDSRRRRAPRGGAPKNNDSGGPVIDV
jgi:putative membrane protein